MTYGEFWLRYLRAHAKPQTRALHYCGSLLAVFFLIAAIAGWDWRFLVTAPVVGYAFAWGAHFGVEGNRPETFGHPFWSVMSDFRMLGLWLTGRLAPELERAGVSVWPR